MLLLAVSVRRKPEQQKKRGVMAATVARRVGGIFALEKPPLHENGLFAALCCEHDDLRHVMSGRCGIVLAIEDFKLQDKCRVAYLPAYTCETVSGCFVQQGYEILYYDVNSALCPQYDFDVLGQISLFLGCGYFGFDTASRQFVNQCASRGIGVIWDVTHCVFTQGAIPAQANYVAGSLRKWLGVACGGFAIKRNSKFAPQLTPPDAQHVDLRYKCFDETAQALASNSDEMLAQAYQTFWQAEMLLRDIYGVQASDEASIEVVTHYPIAAMQAKRCENYAYLLANFPQSEKLRPVFASLPKGTCPSHFSIYCPQREQLQLLLKQNNISASVYWPVPPFIDITQYTGAEKVYREILSLPCDQRCSVTDMERIVAVLNTFAAV